MPTYEVFTGNPNGTVEFEGRVYTEGDIFVPPVDWVRDEAHEEITKRITFLYKEHNGRRDMKGHKLTGPDAYDNKRIMLPLIEVSEVQQELQYEAVGDSSMSDADLDAMTAPEPIRPSTRGKRS